MAEQAKLFSGPASRPPDAKPPESGAETLGMLALSSVSGIGYRALYRLYSAGVSFIHLAEQRSVDGALELMAAAKLRGAATIAEQLIREQSNAMRGAVATQRTLDQQDIRVVHDFDPAFPQCLRRIPNPPGWLFAHGNIGLLESALVGVVGTRTPSRAGIFITDLVCYALAGLNIGSVSGLATGIDERVHATSLGCAIPTVAVLGNGIFRDYPNNSRHLRDAIAQRGGCVVTEYLPDEPPGKETFVWRNRLQAGLSRLLLPTEWQLQSGTAHTVRFALDQGKPVLGLKIHGRATEPAEYLESLGMPVFSLPHETQDLIDYFCRVFAST